MPEDINGTPLADDQTEKSSEENQKKYIPDWMREAGWDESSGTFDESKPVFNDLEDEEEILPADIPAWLEEAAPEGYSFGDDSEESISALIEDDDLIAASPEKDTLSGLSEQSPSTPKISPEEAADEELGIPSWLKDLKLDEDSQETAIAWLENMPASLRATEEDLAAEEPAEPESLEQPKDDLAWMDELYAQKKSKLTEEREEDLAELSEDLVASELIPEDQADDRLFATEELRSFNQEVPSWMKDLGDKEGQPAEDLTGDVGEPADYASARAAIFGQDTKPEEPATERNKLPDWLSELEFEDKSQPSSSLDVEKDTPKKPAASDSQLPDWLSDFEEGSKAAERVGDSTSASLDWLESLAGEAESMPEEFAEPQLDTTEAVTSGSVPERDVSWAVSPSDDTLNTAIPDWLSKIGAAEEREGTQDIQEKDDFEPSLTWLEQLDDQDLEPADQEGSPEDREVMDWLDDMKPVEDEAELDISLEDKPETSQGDRLYPQGLETAKYLPPEEMGPEDLPDWLDKLGDREEAEQDSLEEAILRSGHPLTEEEKDFLSRSKETKADNADWLSKLEQLQGPDSSEPETSPVSREFPSDQEEIPEKEEYHEVSVSGGILDRLKDTGAISQDEEPEIPQWLENLKKEEDPQETAILWLKQFVEKGDKADLNHEIKRYTDELNLGDSIPKWMEDLKKEEDPQTTAMLWLEKLSEERSQKPTPQVKPQKSEDSGWLEALEKEASEKARTTQETAEKDFRNSSEGWLDDLDIDEKLKSAKEQPPEWPQKAAGADGQEGETPPWMKATSPLEGDFYTDELAGNTEKEVEIPAWLAGYEDGEAPAPEEEAATEIETPETVAQKDEYTWLSADEEKPPRPARDPIDLNIAAISQLESILGISYQVAKGIVTYREKHGPFKDISDLMNVPEITDEQTIEILKPEVVIREVKATPAPSPSGKQARFDPAEALKNARTLLIEGHIHDALKVYEGLIKKRKSLEQIIADLQQASQEHPLDVGIMKTLGDAYMRADDLDRALEAYSKAEDLLR